MAIYSHSIGIYTDTMAVYTASMTVYSCSMSVCSRSIGAYNCAIVVYIDATGIDSCSTGVCSHSTNIYSSSTVAESVEATTVVFAKGKLANVSFISLWFDKLTKRSINALCVATVAEPVEATTLVLFCHVERSKTSHLVNFFTILFCLIINKFFDKICNFNKNYFFRRGLPWQTPTEKIVFKTTVAEPVEATTVVFAEGKLAISALILLWFDKLTKRSINALYRTTNPLYIHTYFKF